MKKVWNNSLSGQVEEKNLRKINDFLNYSFIRNQFYKQKYKKAGLKYPFRIRNWTDFCQIPYTTREELVLDQEMNPPFGRNMAKKEKDFVFIRSTSGTTGKRLRVGLTKDDLDKRIIWFSKDLREFMDVRRGMTFMNIMTHGAFAFELPSFIEAGFRAFAPSMMHPDSLVDQLIKSQVEVIQTTPTNIFKMMKSAKRMGVILKNDANVKIILTTGESISEIPSINKIIEREWQAKCLSTIGTAECGRFGFECYRGKKGNHLVKDVCVYEVIDPKTGKESHEGELVITTLWKKDSPYIRYRTGDHVKLDFTSCVCGYQTPRVILESMYRIGFTHEIMGKRFVPHDLDRIIRKHIGISDYRLVIRSSDQIEILLEINSLVSGLSSETLKKDFYNMTGVSPKLSIYPDGSLSQGDWKSKSILDFRIKGAEHEFNLLSHKFNIIKKLNRYLDKLKIHIYNHLN